MSNTTSRSWESLRRGSPDRSRWAAEHRLEAALREGAGYVVVSAAKRADAKAMAARVLDRAEPFALLQISGKSEDPAKEIDALLGQGGAPPASIFERHHVLAELRDRARECGKPVLVVVNDADAAHAARLEAIRMTLEFAPDAVETLRIVLVGSQAVHETLDESDARAFATRVVARIHVPESDGDEEEEETGSKRSRVVSALRKSAFACAGVGGLYLALQVVPPDQRHMPDWLDGARDSVGVHIESLKTSIDAARETAREGAEEEGSAFGVVRAAVERVTDVAKLGAREDAPEPPAPKPVAKAAAKPVAKAPVKRVPVAAPKPAPAASSSIDRLRSSLPVKPGPVVVSEPQVPAALIVASLAPPPPAPRIRTVSSPAGTIMQVGEFSDAADAFALKKALGTRFGSLHVARFDGAAGPVYRVRVFGFRTHEQIARAQETILATGYVPEIVESH